jgi:MFS transporter, ACS family, hexuronate transporter
LGVNRGISAAVVWWSLAEIGSGLVNGLGGLFVFRSALGLGESAGVPGASKVNGLYLRPGERALGAAVNGVGLSIGSALAPLWIGMALAHSWRAPFIWTGLLGFVWIPLWLFVSRRIPAPQGEDSALHGVSPEEKPRFALLRDRSLILLTIANALWMGSYYLWSNWTTLYLTNVHHLSLKQTASFTWIPPLVSNFGGFFGGWLSLAWMRRGVPTIEARQRAVWASAAGSLVTLLLPFAPDPVWATTIISASFFFALSGSVNIYAMPVDIFGAARAGLAISALTCAFGLLQMVISPVVGYLGDHKLYNQVVWLVTLPLVVSPLVLRGCRAAGKSGEPAHLIPLS